jgi:hypothetical protein
MQNYTRNWWRRCKTTLEIGGEDLRERVTTMGVISQFMGGLVAWPVGSLSDSARLGRKGPIYFSCLLMTLSYVTLVFAPHVVSAEGEKFIF